MITHFIDTLSKGDERLLEKSSQAKHDGGEGMEQLVCPMARGCVMTTLC